MDIMSYTTNKKERIAILVAVIAIGLGMYTVGNSYAAGSLWGIGSAQISIDEAAAIGIAHLKTDSSNLNSIGIERDGESFIYNLDFAIKGQEVSVEIDPHTGEVLHITEEPLATDSESDRTDANDSNDGSAISDGDGEEDDD